MIDPAIDLVGFTCLEKPDKSRCPQRTPSRTRPTQGGNKMTNEQINDEMPCEETRKDYIGFRTELSELINKHSLESGSHTPDFMLSDFLVDVLMGFDRAVIRRNSWHDFPARLCVLQRERDQWRECAERLAKSIAMAPLFPTNSMESAVAEFNRLRGEIK